MFLENVSNVLTMHDVMDCIVEAPIFSFCNTTKSLPAVLQEAKPGAPLGDLDGL